MIFVVCFVENCNVNVVIYFILSSLWRFVEFLKVVIDVLFCVIEMVIKLFFRREGNIIVGK